MSPQVETYRRGGAAGFAWVAYLAIGALMCLLYVAVPPFRGSGPLMNVLGLSPVVAILAGIRMHRPASASPWRWFAAGFALFWFGDLYTYSYPLLLNGDVPFPSLGDGAYIAVYPALVTGLALLVSSRRRSGGDSGRLIDSLILTVGLTLPSWVALIAPYVHDGDAVLRRQGGLGRLPGRRRVPARRGDPAGARRRPPRAPPSTS